MENTIPRMVEAAAQKFGRNNPSLNAIEDGDSRLTFAQLWEQGLRVARAFGAAGIAPGDRVAIWAPNIHEWILAAIGLQAVGACLVTINTRLKGGEAAYILRNSGARVLCTLSTFLDVNYLDMLQGQDLPDLERIIVLRADDPSSESTGSADSAGSTGSADSTGSTGSAQRANRAVESWAEFLASGETFSEDEARSRAAAVSPDDVSDLIFTSGTTGKAKGVATCHGQNLRCFEAWTEVVGLKQGDRYLIINPFFHSFGYKAGWLSCIMRGATALPQLVFDVPEVLERIGKDCITMLPGAPTIYQSLLAHPDLAEYDIRSLRLAVTGAAAIPVELIHRMRDELGFETIITGYGLTETCGIVTMCRYDDDPETIATTSGKAIPDVEVKCVDPEGQEVPRGEPGEVIVRGYNVMQGYFGDAEETARTIDSAGWLHTGDIAVMNERGYLRITDRIKDMYIVGGFNCYPAEIENLMYSSGLFAQVAVIGVPDERLGEVGMAWVVPTPLADITPSSVIAWCRENMANYKAPRRVKIVSELPTNAAGKVVKYELRERAAAEA